MSARIELDGMDELKRALANLPVHLNSEAMTYVREATEGAFVDVKALYTAHTVSGNLAKGVRKEYPSSTLAVGRVRSTAYHAHLFEWGSQMRTFKGASRGRMPPAGTNGAVPIFQRKRRRMNEQLIAMVKREGFEVSGA